jgi:hypothetical protein
MSKKIEPYPFEIPLERINPESAVLEEIREQHPWHWDPTKQDHNDDKCFVKNVANEFDWESLAKWCITKANEHRVPEKYWWYDYENDKIWHATDDATDAPIREQALLALKNNYHDVGNSQYYKFANSDFEHWEEPLRELFPEFKKDKLGVSLFIQPPGHTMYSHVDTFSSFIRRTGDEKANYKTLRRYMVFVRDWDWGHFFHMGNACLNQWKAGDLWDITPGKYHGSANCGMSPKLTIHWSGEIDEAR